MPTKAARAASTIEDADIDIDWELRLGFLIHDVSRLRRSAFDRPFFVPKIAIQAHAEFMFCRGNRTDSLAQYL